MKYLSVLFFFVISFNSSFSTEIESIFFVGKMESYNKNFTLYFKTRNKPILAKGEPENYIAQYPQDLYLYDHKSKKDYKLISYDWFPRKAKKFLKNYGYPVFPEDFAYYLLKDNNTLIMVSAIKNINKNFQYDIKKKELKSFKKNGSLDFIISAYAKKCGYKSLIDKFECNIYKPLISKNLIILNE